MTNYLCSVNIWVLGAGLSSSGLLKYLATHADFKDCNITVFDLSADNLHSRCQGYDRLKTHIGNASDPEFLRNHLQKGVVISLLPPMLHPTVGKVCLEKEAHLITASYVSHEMSALDSEAKKKGLLFLNECGLDPGIDHLSAMQIMDQLKSEGAEITGFKSYCGGLVANEHDTNPWHYKFSWNPMNVVLAGQSAARCKENGRFRYIPSSRIFQDIEQITLPNGEMMDAYLNRDSLGYVEPYGLKDAKTIKRGTLRGLGYGYAWSILVHLGLTDHSYILPISESCTWNELLQQFLPPHTSLESFCRDALSAFSQDIQEKAWHKIQWLFENLQRPIGLFHPSPAQALLSLLQDRWALKKGELDRVVMIHQIDYLKDGQRFLHQSTLDIDGKPDLSAMAMTVGLPLGMAARQIIARGCPEFGVAIPLSAHWYQPLLTELSEHGVHFINQTQAHGH